MKISAVYKITNTITNDFYIGSSKDVKERWRNHKKPSKWKQYPNNLMYLDMQKYGLDKFEFQVIAEVEIEQLKETEQQFIETLKPTYNKNRAKGWDSETHNKYQKSDKGKETHRKSQNKYDNQLCFYNSKTLTLAALASRFIKAGIEHPYLEAKKYLLNKS